MNRKTLQSIEKSAARIPVSVPARSWQLAPTPQILRALLIEDITRRDFLVGAGGLLLLAPYGCGNGGEEGGESPSGETRTMEHAFGEVKVPARLRRVVVLNPIAFDASASLGPQPVASVSNLVSLHDEQLENVEAELDPVEPSLERIAALEPDLILHAGFEGELFSSGSYEQFSEIAPTAVYAFESDAKWKDYFRFYADVLNESGTARELLADYEARTEKLRERLGGVEDISVSVLRVREDSIENFRVDNSFSDSILDDIGFGETPGVPETLSLELIPDIEADYLFIYTFGGTEAEDQSVEEQLEEVTSSPLWSRNPAVREGRAYEVGDYWFGFGVTSANAVLDDLERYLLEGEAS